MSWQNLLEADARFSARLGVAEKAGLLRRLAILFGHSGDSWFWLAGMLLLIGLGDFYWRAWGVAYVVGIMVTAVTVMAIKFSVRRRRPEGSFGQIYRRTDPHSFPSGHAARAMLLAVLAVGTGPLWFSILLVIWAPLVGLARIATGLHYISDVLVGWLLGAAIGIAMLNLYDFTFLV